MIHQIEIGGKTRPVSFGRNALVEFEKLTGIKMLSGRTDFFQSFEGLGAFAYSALKWGLYNPSNGKEPKPDFTLAQVNDWLEQTPEVMAEIFELFEESMPEKKSKASEPSNQSPAV